jgi:hypothetical protein
MSIADTGTKLLAEFGEAVSLTYETDEVRNPATGEVTTPATESVVSGFGYPSRFQNAEVDGTVIKRSDTRLILNKVDEAPSKDGVPRYRARRSGLWMCSRSRSQAQT